MIDCEALDGRTYRVHGAPVRDDDGEIQGGMLVSYEAVTPAEEHLISLLRQQSAIAELGKFAVKAGARLEVLIEHAVRLATETLSVDGMSVVELGADQEHFGSQT